MTTLDELADEKIIIALTIDVVYDINCYVIVDFVKEFMWE